MITNMHDFEGQAMQAVLAGNLEMLEKLPRSMRCNASPIIFDKPSYAPLYGKDFMSTRHIACFGEQITPNVDFTPSAVENILDWVLLAMFYVVIPLSVLLLLGTSFWLFFTYDQKEEVRRFQNGAVRHLKNQILKCEKEE